VFESSPPASSFGSLIIFANQRQAENILSARKEFGEPVSHRGYEKRR
jgi:hypothetical protein